MAIDIMKLFDDDKYVSPGSIGGKIKKYRELRNRSQKDLGIRCGFSASTADVRIAQYEKNKKIPREKALKEIAAALEIDEYALFDADLLPYNRMYHALFDIEDFHGLHPVKREDGYYLEFSGPTEIAPDGVTHRDYQDFLEKWHEMRQKYLPNNDDSAEEKEDKKRKYALWRAEYPQNAARENAEKMRDMIRMHRLQAEMDELNAKMKSDEELTRIDKAMEDFLPQIKAAGNPVERESELIFLIKDLLEKGLHIERFSPEEKKEIDYDFMHLLSIRTEEILSDDRKKELFALLMYSLETIREQGINITRSITSRNKELYLTYKYPSSRYECFDNLQKHWDDIFYILERKPGWPEDEIEELEEKLRDEITGEKDVAFSK